MSETIDVTAEQVPVPKKQTFMQEVFGQLRQPAFWVSLFRTCVIEALKSFAAVVSGEIGKYASGGRYQNGYQPVQPQSPVAARAFGNGYQPTPSYQPGSSYPVPTSQPAGDARFPGFGSPR